MQKVVIAIAWIASVIAAGYIGMRYGESKQAEQELLPLPIETAPQTQTPAPLTQTQPVTDPFVALVAGGRHFAAIDLALDRLSRDPSNHALRFQLAELYRTTHQFDEAIKELLTIRSLSLMSSDLSRARTMIDNIVRAADERFQQSRAISTAISFFERQTVQEPSYDLHRYFLAKWLLRSGDTVAADRIIREIGLAGITAAERDTLKAELARRTATLPVRREGKAIYADVEVTTPNGQTTLTLLVDTGATLTAIAHYQLREMGAVRTAHSVTAQTANGSVEVPVFELQAISGGPLTLNNFLVASLDDLPSHVDGLLGLDFLDQLPVPIVNTN